MAEQGTDQVKEPESFQDMIERQAGLAAVRASLGVYLITFNKVQEDEADARGKKALLRSPIIESMHFLGEKVSVVDGYQGTLVTVPDPIADPRIEDQNAAYHALRRVLRQELGPEAAAELLTSERVTRHCMDWDSLRRNHHNVYVMALGEVGSTERLRVTDVTLKSREEGKTLG